MAKASLTVRFTFIFSLSISAAYALSPPKIPKATPSDLLALLGPKPKVNPLVARELDSCFRFLVPFKPFSRQRRSLARSTEREENELVWWPPHSILDLARIAVHSGGDPAAIQRALDPTPINVTFLALLFRIIFLLYVYGSVILLNHRMSFQVIGAR